MRTYYIERTNDLAGISEISRIDAQSLPMALYIAEMMYGPSYTYKTIGSAEIPNRRTDPYDNAILRLSPDMQKMYREKYRRALQNVRRPQ